MKEARSDNTGAGGGADASAAGGAGGNPRGVACVVRANGDTAEPACIFLARVLLPKW